MKMNNALAITALAAFATSACVDLDVANPNDADAQRALRTAGDVESLIAGSYVTWWNASGSTNGIAPILMTVAYGNSATAANFGMVEFSGWPKVPVHYLPANVYYGQFQYSWIQHYRAVSAVVDGLVAIETGTVKLEAAAEARAKAYGYYVLGLAHASTAILYDQGYIYDPTIDPNEVELHPAKDVLTAAFGYFDKAITAATGATFTVPALWISADVASAQLARMAYSMKARYRAAMARTPTNARPSTGQQ